MKKFFVYTMCAALLMSSCGTYEGAGAYAGAQFGSILGSAIGGITDGPRGSDVGTIIGMAGGAAVGGAIGAAKDKKNRQEVHDRYQQVQQRKAKKQQGVNQRQSYDSYDSGFDETNSGDDRLYDFNGPEYNGSYNNMQPTVENIGSDWSGLPQVEVRNVRFVDGNGDNALSRGELCKVIFEVYNHGQQALYDVQPVVTTDNKRVYVSPGIHVERIAPDKGIRYTALLKTENRVKNGTLKINVSVLQGNSLIAKPQTYEVKMRK